MTRLEKLRAKIPSGVDALLITNEITQRYLTEFEYTDGYVLVSPTDAILLCDFRYIEAAKAQTNKDYEVRMFKGSRKDWMSALLCELGIKTLAFEDVTLPCAELESLKNDLAGVEFVPMGSIIDDMREYKDESEIEKIIAAQRIAEQAFEHILGYINPDRTEIDVALELEFFMRSHGADGVSFKTIAVSGSASSLPHGEPRPCKLEKGFLTMDYGALYQGYCSDMTRTVCIGKADDEMKKVYDTVLRAQTESLAALREGITGVEADKVARDIIYGAGYEGCFGHGLGHGVGMYIHEAPRLSPMGQKPLTRGHVVTVEPGIYLEGKYGVRIEDMVWFGENGPEDITLARRELIEL